MGLRNVVYPVIKPVVYHATTRRSSGTFEIVQILDARRHPERGLPRCPFMRTRASIVGATTGWAAAAITSRGLIDSSFLTPPGRAYGDRLRARKPRRRRTRSSPRSRRHWGTHGRAHAPSPASLARQRCRCRCLLRDAVPDVLMVATALSDKCDISQPHRKFVPTHPTLSNFPADGQTRFWDAVRNSW
jgi:hypothetical protein